jgi:hypothetical protein
MHHLIYHKIYIFNNVLFSHVKQYFCNKIEDWQYPKNYYIGFEEI